MRPPRLALAATCAGLLLTACAPGAAPQPAAAPSSSPVAFHGRQPHPVPERPSFTLRTTSGAPYDFAEQTGGKPTLLYFGYTSCPDECPTAMADISAALRSTPADLRDDVEVVFVTTDPDRDSGPVLRAWLDQFSQHYVGLLGTQAEVDAAQVAAGVAVAQKGGPVETLPGRPNEHVHRKGTAPHRHDRPLGYGVAHTNAILAFDTRDRLPVLYPAGVRPADLAADLPLLAQGDAP